MDKIKQEFERLKNLPHKEVIISQEIIQKEIERNKTIRLINEYKRKLFETDYKAIKYAEGLISETDYAPIKAERENYRKAINSLEISLN